jgi:hypothetical protein
MSSTRDSRMPAQQQVATPGNDRAPDQAPHAADTAPVQAHSAPGNAPEPTNPVEPSQRPPPPAPRPEDRPASTPNSSSISASLAKLNLGERFIPEARDLAPPLVSPGFQAQDVYNQIFAYYNWRFTDIAYASDSTIAYVPQIANCANRVAYVALNAIVNKLIIGNRTDGLHVATLANPVGPPKGFLYPALAAAVITAIGKTSPKWSGDQFFIPNLDDAIPTLVDSDGNAIANCHQFLAAPGTDMIVQRFCAAGKIPLRSTDWKIPGGTPHWLAARDANNGRLNLLVAPDVHPDNFDPPNTLLATICSSTALTAANCRYLIMRGIAETTVWSLVSEVYEE